MPKTLTNKKAKTDRVLDSQPSQPPIWEKIQQRMKSVPLADAEKLPRDGAAEHDHYLYGTPKRNGL